MILYPNIQNLNVQPTSVQSNPDGFKAIWVTLTRCPFSSVQTQQLISLPGDSRFQDCLLV